MVNETARPHEETIKTVFRIQFLDFVKESGDDVMTAGRLSTGEDYTHIHLGIVGCLGRFKLNERHPVSVRE